MNEHTKAVIFRDFSSSKRTSFDWHWDTPNATHSKFFFGSMNRGSMCKSFYYNSIRWAHTSTELYRNAWLWNWLECESDSKLTLFLSFCSTTSTKYYTTFFVFNFGAFANEHLWNCEHFSNFCCCCCYVESRGGVRLFFPFVTTLCRDWAYACEIEAAEQSTIDKTDQIKPSPLLCSLLRFRIVDSREGKVENERENR